MTSVVLVRGAAEVRIHRVTGAPSGTPVRVTGWPTENAELLPALGLDDSLTGHITDDTMLFVALARLTADPATRSDP